MDVSIIIPLCNRLDLTRACLESLARTIPGRLRYEVILVDDGSTDGTRDFLRTLPTARYRVLLNPAPRGYAANNNAAARAARAPVLCLLNNDTVLLPGWLEPMLYVLRRAPKAACVGNIQREPYSGLIDHIGVGFNDDGHPVHAGKNEALLPIQVYTRWLAVTAACWVVRADLFTRLGGFDETFRNGFEDTDFCLRAGELGYRHYVANRSVIYHYISASPGRRSHEDENLQHYRERWGAGVAAYMPFQRAREAARQQFLVSRAAGRRYLRKHLRRPWRYNLGRIRRAWRETQPPAILSAEPPPIPASDAALA